MTTHDRAVSGGLPDDAGLVGELVESTPRPGEDAQPPPAVGLGQREVCFHEAAHACAAWLYRQPLSVVSTRPGAQYRGVTAFEHATRIELEDFDWSAPALLQPFETRATVERQAVISLVGGIAGLYARWTSDVPSHGYVAPEPCDDAERAVQALAALSPRHRELVLAMEADETAIDNDETTAAKWSGLFFIDEPDEAAAHLHWLRTTARDLVVEQWERIARLAAVLEERIVLSGEEAVAILTPYPTSPRRR